MKKQKTAKNHFYQRKPFLWTVGSIAAIIVIILIAFRVSPWPGAMLIRAVFEQNNTKVAQALEKHTPTLPITVMSDQKYRSNDNDALLDVYFANDKIAATSHLPAIVWTHGGAWVSGSKTNAAPYYKLLAAAGFTVVSVNYSLAPGGTYPTALHQLNAAHNYILNNADRFHIDKNKIVLAGDSAGSQLSSQLAALITNPSYAKEVGIDPSLEPSQLRGVILNCGIYKMHKLTVPDPTLPKIVGWGTDISVWAYANTRDFSDPIIKQMSPYYHVTADFPATYISGGNGDPLTKVQSKPFAAKLQSLKVPVTSVFYPDNHTPSLPHEYQFNLDNADGTTALQKTINFAQSQTK